MSINNQLDEIIDFKQFFFKIITNWYFFALSLIFAFAIAFTYNRYAQELYNIETTILINEDNIITNPSELLYEKAIPNQYMNLEDRELILTSYPLVYATLAELNFDISYAIIGNIKVTETYLPPIKVECDNTALIKGRSIIIECIDEEQFDFSKIQNFNRQEIILLGVHDELQIQMINVRNNFSTNYFL